MPNRVLLSRKKGARKPKGVVGVARPSKWGNPFKVGGNIEGEPIESRSDAVRHFRAMLEFEDRNYPSLDEIRRELAGKDLACWCPLDEPCHADVLLEIANRVNPSVLEFLERAAAELEDNPQAFVEAYVHGGGKTGVLAVPSVFLNRADIGALRDALRNVER